MGRTILIIVSGLVLSGSIVQISLQTRQQDLYERTNDFARDVQTRNMANSGLKFALNTLNADSTWRDGMETIPFGEGTLSVAIADYNDDPSLKANQVELTATGILQHDTSQVIGLLEFQGGLPPAPSPVGIYSNNLAMNVSGNSVVIDGNDQAGGDPLPGLTVGGSDAYNNVMSSLTEDQLENIAGSGGGQSVHQKDLSGDELQEYIDKYTTNPDQIVESDLNSTVIGTSENPQITVVNGDINISSVSGAGILVVAAGNSISITGNFTFDGLVILQGNTNFEADIYGNTNITGGLMCASIDPTATFDLDLRGNVGINYNSQILAALEMDLAGQTNSQLAQVARYE